MHWGIRRNRWLFRERNEIGFGSLPVLQMSNPRRNPFPERGALQTKTEGRGQKPMGAHQEQRYSVQHDAHVAGDPLFRTWATLYDFSTHLSSRTDWLCAESRNSIPSPTPHWRTGIDNENGDGATVFSWQQLSQPLS